jgi:hypothetical protein
MGEVNNIRVSQEGLVWYSWMGTMIFVWVKEDGLSTDG